jgi:glutathione S-transferase
MGKSGKYVFGDTITAADILFYPQVLATQSRWSVNISHHPNVNRILNNLL